jgi:hypothetical protein
MEAHPQQRRHPRFIVATPDSPAGISPVLRCSPRNTLRYPQTTLQTNCGVISTRSCGMDLLSPLFMRVSCVAFLCPNARKMCGCVPDHCWAALEGRS